MANFKDADYIANRVIKHARMLLEKGATIRSVSEKSGFSKSTVHKDLRERLEHINLDLYIKVLDILDYNKSTRHTRGGEATRKKWLGVKETDFISA